MSEQNPNDLNPAGLSEGARLRAVADGELDASHVVGVDKAEGRLAFERDLRDSVRRSIADANATAPKLLRERIQTILEAEGVGGGGGGASHSPT